MTKGERLPHADPIEYVLSEARSADDFYLPIALESTQSYVASSAESREYRSKVA